MSAGSASALVLRLAGAPVRRVAVIQTAFLGDTVFSSALIAGVAACFPGAGITMVVTPRGRDVAAAIPGVDDVLVYDKRGSERGLLGFARIAQRLRERRSELAILPHRSLRSSLLAWRAGIPERLGFANAPGRFFYTAVVPDPGGPFLAREAALLEPLGALAGPMRLVSTDTDRRAAEERLRVLTPQSVMVGAATVGAGIVGAPIVGPAMVGIATIGAATNSPRIAFALGSEWETKIWPTPFTAELARRFAARGFTPLLLGGPREKSIAAEILRACPSALDTTGNPIGEALGLLALSSLCVGGDSGLAHAARALSIPTLLLFGPTDPKLHQLGSGERALSLQLECSPCGLHGHHRCPLGHHRCLREMSVDQVETSALALLGERAGTAARSCLPNTNHGVP